MPGLLHRAPKRSRADGVLVRRKHWAVLHENLKESGEHSGGRDRHAPDGTEIVQPPSVPEAAYPSRCRAQSATDSATISARSWQWRWRLSPWRHRLQHLDPKRKPV